MSNSCYIFKSNEALTTNRILYPLFVCVVLALSCSSSKKSGNSAPSLSENYHNVTARYNAHYHAKLKLNSGFQSLNDAHKDDYNQILSIYPFADASNATTVSADMDEVIKKASFVIEIHKQSKWVDDAYLAIGIARFLKQEYDDARIAFQYIGVKFDPDNPYLSDAKLKAKKRKPGKRKPAKRKPPKKKSKKRKPGKKKPGKRPSSKPIKGGSSNPKYEKKTAKDDIEEEDDKKSILDIIRHRPARDEALLWLVRSYIRLKQYDDAEAILTIVHSEEVEYRRKLRGELKALESYSFIKEKDYLRAIEPLEQSIEETKNKKKRTRYMYVLAQLYQITDQNSAAIEQFKKVLDDGRPDYEMEFQAKINIAKSFGNSGSSDGESVLKLLAKMLKDLKNEEYFDQVYYAMAEIELKRNNEDQGIIYLKKSAAIGKANLTQKANSYFKLAEIYYSHNQYVPAKAYYDSTSTVMAKVDERLPMVLIRKEKLGEVVQQLDIIAEEDSLQKVANLPEKERKALLRKLAAKKESEKEKFKKNEEFMSENEPIGSDSDPMSSSRPNRGGKWYFYNASSRATGFSDFINTWGNLELEDDWRRSNKKSFSFEVGSLDEEDEELESEDEFSIENLEEGLPISEEAKTKSDNRLIEAYYTLAGLYNSELENYKMAIKTYEHLNNTYPGHQYESASLYYLYILYLKIGNKSKAEVCRNQLLNSHSETLLAKRLKDPNFVDPALKTRQEVTNYYASTYDLYSVAKYDAAFARIKKANELYKNNYLKPKFDLLEAMLVGKTQDIGAFKKSLFYVVRTHPQDEVYDKAQELLGYIVKKEKEAKTKKPGSKKAVVYNKDIEGQHYVGIVIEDANTRLQPIIDSLANYNAEFHSLTKLTLKKMNLTSENNFIQIRTFKSRKKAVAYQKELNRNDKLFGSVDKKNIYVFAITTKNFSKFFIKKDVAGYKKFFEENYN